MVNAVVFEDVHKRYSTSLFGRRGIDAVRGVQLAVPAGTVFALLGPNRAGKTTLVKMLLSLSRPTKGQIQRLDAPTGDRRTLARVGYMHENHAFPRYLTATELLHLYGGLSLVRTEELPARVPQLLEQVGLADRAHEPIARFSKGMIQRLGLAQALINDPELLILDEPTEGLDLFGRQTLRQVILDLKKRGRTVLLVSHVLSEVEQLCDQVAVLVEGRIVRTAPLKELTFNPHSGRHEALEAVLPALYKASQS